MGVSRKAECSAARERDPGQSLPRARLRMHPFPEAGDAVPRPAKNLKLEERIEVARRFAAGESAKDLAAAFGISPRHVNRLAKEEAGEGIAVRDPSETVAFRASRSELDSLRCRVARTGLCQPVSGAEYRAAWAVRFPRCTP